MPESLQNKWIKIAESITELKFSQNGLTEIEVGEKKICVGIHANEFFACTQKCPHAGGHLAEGHVDTVGNIVCPLHRYKFNPRNGRNTTGEGYYLKVFPIEIRDTGVYILIRTTAFYE